MYINYVVFTLHQAARTFKIHGPILETVPSEEQRCNLTRSSKSQWKERNEILKNKGKEEIG
jgi:hypothetical protein